MKRKEFKIQIFGETWTILGLPRKSFFKYKDINKTDGAATFPSDRRIVFNLSDGVDLYYIRHELLHAFYAESPVDSSNPDPDQVEEICATIVGKHLKEIDRLSEFILTELLKK